jgi:hypothetical protein
VEDEAGIAAKESELKRKGHKGHKENLREFTLRIGVFPL